MVTDDEERPVMMRRLPPPLSPAVGSSGARECEGSMCDVWGGMHSRSGSFPRRLAVVLSRALGASRRTPSGLETQVQTLTACVVVWEMWWKE